MCFVYVVYFRFRIWWGIFGLGYEVWIRGFVLGVYGRDWIIVS